MKKIAVLLAMVAVTALAAPAFSAMTNPFMDVPMNHWAYDAIGQLAVHHIIDGYPDGLYKGKQPATRYEIASVVARALAVVDMTKASKQDVEMLKRLVVEFKDELEALGVRVDELDERVAVLESRLGGWHIHGSLVADVRYRKAETPLTGKGDGEITFDEARLWFERTFGENDEYFFAARIRDEGGQKGADSDIRFDRFYVSMPFFMDSKFTVGRFNYNMGKAYIPSIPATGGWGGDPVLTNLTLTGFALEKNFGMGNFLAYIAHDDKMPDSFKAYSDTPKYDAATGQWVASQPHGVNRKSWQIFAMGQFQFTENIGIDLGGQAFIGDNSSSKPIQNPRGQRPADYLNYEGDTNFKNLWTIFAALRFNFNDNIAIKGAFYHQKINAERVGYNNERTSFGWRDYGYGIPDGTKWVDDANHWRAIIDVKQEALKFTSLWLEYGQYDKGFWAPQGMSSIFFSESTVLKHFLNGGDGSQLAGDTKYWRVVLGQEWNEKWATHIFYYGYKVDRGNNEDSKPYELGVGIQYKLNDATTMGLNYVHVDSDLPDGALNNEEDAKDDIVRFRTAVTF